MVVQCASKKIFRYLAMVFDMHTKSKPNCFSFRRSLVYELKGNVPAARRVLVSAVHTYPHLSKLWSKLSLHLMEHDQSNTKSRGAATKCLQGAVVLDRHSAQEQSIKPEVSILGGSQSGRQGGVELSCLLALSHVVNNDHQMAIKAASSAVHR